MSSIRCWIMWSQNSVSSYVPIPLCVARLMTSRPSRKGMVRRSGHGRRGWRRLTRRAPHRYAAATSAVNAVTIGANCQLVAASPQLNGGNMAPPPMGKRLPLSYALS